MLTGCSGAAPFNSIVLWDDDSQPYRSGYPRKSGQGSKFKILKTAIVEAEVTSALSVVLVIVLILYVIWCCMSRRKIWSFRSKNASVG